MLHLDSCSMGIADSLGSSVLFFHLKYRIDARVIFVTEPGDRAKLKDIDASIKCQRSVVDMDCEHPSDDHIVLRRWLIAWQFHYLMQPAFEMYRGPLNSGRAHEARRQRFKSCSRHFIDTAPRLKKLKGAKLTTPAALVVVIHPIGRGTRKPLRGL
jgi:hypothetical protein